MDLQRLIERVGEAEVLQNEWNEVLEARDELHQRIEELYSQASSFTMAEFEEIMYAIETAKEVIDDITGQGAGPLDSLTEIYNF